MNPRDGDGSPFVLRPARIDDRATLIELMRRASLHWPANYVEALLAHPEMIDIPAAEIEDGRIVVATRGRVAVGFVTVLPRQEGHAELEAIFVEPAEWRRGIGRLLMAAADDMALRLGANVIDVIANPQAEGFYRACGFEVTGWKMTRFAPALTMSKTLPTRGRS